MNCKEIQDLFIAYQMQDISNEDKDLIENHIKSCNTCEEELQKTISFMTDLNSIENEIPSFKIKENFEILLQEEIEKETVKVIPLKEKKDWKTFTRVAASIVIIIGTFLLGKYSNEQKTHQNTEQTAMFTLLDNQSASKRILAVSKLEKSSIDDTKIINALINKMFIDENINVRMAACEALTKFSSLETVKNAFLKALEIEKEPAIQIELIQILASIQEKRALVPMKKLLEKEETPNYVKQELSSKMASLI